MDFSRPLNLFGTQMRSGVSHESFHNQLIAHADFAVDHPIRKLDFGGMKSFTPGKNMLVNTIN
jgi:hypothetical protein